MKVLVCQKLETFGSGLDLQAIKAWFRDQTPEVSFQIQPGPCCERAWWQKASLSEASGLVLGLCSRDYSMAELEAQARKAGLDPFGVEVVNLGSYCAQVSAKPQATEKAKILLKAACARAEVFPESRPDSVKPVLSWDHTVSRRSLFTLPPLRYEPVASIRKESCISDEGCRVCANSCPRQALSPLEDGPMTCDKSRCTGCGACVSACPQTAIDLPGASSKQIEAQIAALVNTDSASLYPRAILFVCRKSAHVLDDLARKGLSYPPNWIPMEVPCIGMVTPTWLLHCLDLGAAAAAVLPCERDDCRFGQREVVEGRIAYCREFLELIGGTPDSVRLLDPLDEERLASSLKDLPVREKRAGGNGHGEPPLFAPGASAQTILGLAEQFASPLDRTLMHPYSPVGVVTISQGCTACEACVHACPTRALRVQRDTESMSLIFDATLCIGCQACASICPERVVRVEKVTDLSLLAQGRFTLYRDSEVRCQTCGAPIAPGAMLKKITALLGSHPAVPAITRYCLSCRGVLTPGPATVEKVKGGEINDS
jgi:ferredoxin